MKCTHHWTVTSECPKCLRDQLDMAVNELASVERSVGAALRKLRRGCIAVDVVSEPRRVFKSIAEATEYASGKLHMPDATRAEAAKALGAGRHFSFAYGFVDCTMIPQVEQ